METFEFIGSSLVFVFISCWLGIAVHELSHAAAAASRGIKICRISFNLKGPVCELGFTAKTLPLWSKPELRLFVASAGVIGNMVLASLGLYLAFYLPGTGWMERFFLVLGLINVGIILRELTPTSEPGHDLELCLIALKEIYAQRQKVSKP